MKLTKPIGTFLILCLCLAISLTSAADNITKGDKALRAGDTAKAIAAYQKALGSRDAGVREDAIDRLARVGGTEATLALSQALKDADPDVVEAAAQALAMVKDPGSTPALIEALNFPLTEEGTKRELLRAIGQSGGPLAAAAIVPHLHSMDDKVRREAALALALVGTQADVPALEAAATDPTVATDYKLQSALQQAITQAGTRPAPPPPAPPAAEEEPPAGAPQPPEADTAEEGK